jgi:hypothetical protein
MPCADGRRRIPQLGLPGTSHYISRSPVRLLAMTIAEFRLLLQGQNAFWLAIAVLLIFLGMLMPLPVITSTIYPLACIWPLALWSDLGVRECRHRTNELILSSPHLQHRLVATWLSASVVAAILGIGLGARYLLSADIDGLWAWLPGIFFIPSLFLALGTCVASSKVSQLIYLIWWYLGPWGKIGLFDFLGVSPQPSASIRPLLYLILAGVLFLVAFWGYPRRLERAADYS